jgi:hypothetical protein
MLTSRQIVASNHFVRQNNDNPAAAEDSIGLAERRF